MTLGDLRHQLKQIGIRQVGTLRRPASEGQPESLTLVFSGDEKIIVPFGLSTVYFLITGSDDDAAVIHSEKVKALARAIERDRPKGPNLIV